MKIIPSPRNLNDLYLEYARCILMCRDNNNVDVYRCVKLNNKIFSVVPAFVLPMNYYKFAIAIVDNTPIFVGDTVYLVDHGNLQFIIKSVDPYGNLYLESSENERTLEQVITQNEIKSKIRISPERKTFILNGVELPSPTRHIETKYAINLGVKRYYFFTESDKLEVLDNIHDILAKAV